jgi:hypothetical protein
MVHIHVRDANGNHSHHKELYRETIGRIRESCEDLIIVATTSGRRAKNVSERMGPLELDAPYRPDMASLTLGSMNFPAGPSVNSPEDIGACCLMAGARHPAGWRFSPACLLQVPVNRGFLTGRPYANIILPCTSWPPGVRLLPSSCLGHRLGRTGWAFPAWHPCLSMAMGVCPR